MSFREPSDQSWRELFDAMILANRRVFWEIAARILRDGGVAEDACQQAYLKAWERRNELRTAEAIKPWITRMVTNECLGEIRRRKNEQRALQNRAQHPWDQASDSAVNSERREALLLAIDKLKEPQRTIVILRQLSELSGAVTSELTGHSEGEVSKQLHRGLERLRILLAE